MILYHDGEKIELFLVLLQMTCAPLQMISKVVLMFKKQFLDRFLVDKTVNL